MTPVPKKKQSKGRTGRRRGKGALKKSDLYRMYSKGKGLEKKRK